MNDQWEESFSTSHTTVWAFKEDDRFRLVEERFGDGREIKIRFRQCYGVNTFCAVELDEYGQISTRPDGRVGWGPTLEKYLTEKEFLILIRLRQLMEELVSTRSSAVYTI